MLVTLESTTYPGTTEEIVQPILESFDLKVGTDLHLAFSPERVDPGNPVYQTKNTPKVVGGVTAQCTEVAVAFYERFLDTVVPVSSTRTAEMTKLLENIFRCVNIALMNELLLVSERMGINIWEVVDAAKTKPFGFMPFYPGPGLGGHCIPIDPFYLSWKARQFDMHTEFIELAGKTNEAMPYYVVERLMSALNTHRKPLAGSRVLILGVAYKANIDDMRESPAIKIAELLRAKEADVVYHDPFVSEFIVEGERVPARRADRGRARRRRCGTRRDRPLQRRLRTRRALLAARPGHPQRPQGVPRRTNRNAVVSHCGLCPPTEVATCDCICAPNGGRRRELQARAVHSHR